MTKRSHRRQVRYEESSCMWGLISILDFRHASRSSRKLLPDKRRRSRRTADESDSTVELLINVNEIPEETSSSKAVYDARKTSVKALIEEEMVNEGDKSGLEGQTKTMYRKRSRRYSQESFDLSSNGDLDAAESLNSECPYHKEDQDTENHHIMEEFCNRMYENSDTNQASKTIVVLKPMSNNLNSLSESSQGKSDNIEKSSSGFFFEKIKKRWKNVMGKECDGEKLENFCDKSPKPSKQRFYIEKFARPRREETIVKLNDADAIESPNSSKRRVPNIYVEAKKHLLERLSSGIEEADSSGRRSPDTLARILAISEFNSLVPSPRRDSERSSITAKLRFSGHEEENELLSSNKLEKFSSSSTAEMNSEGDLENLRTIVIIEDKIVTIDEERNHSLDTLDQNGHLEQPKEMHHHDDSEATPPTSPIIKKTEDLDRAANEAARPSPVSVLDPLCMEEGDISPARSIESVEVRIQPLQIKFEEQFSKSCMDEETLADYIKATLQACGLNWEELYMKSQTSDQLLDPSLFDEVSFCCNQHTDNIHMLLFDCINEVLLEVCGCFLGSKKSIRPVADMESVVSEVVKGVKHWYLTDLPRTTQTLDQIIKNDMSRSGSWMDLQLHIEEIGVDLAEDILDDLIEDIAASSMDEVENHWNIDP